MNANRMMQQKKTSEALNKGLEKSLAEWLDHELPKMIEEKIQEIQTTEDV